MRCVALRVISSENMDLLTISYYVRDFYMQLYKINDASIKCERDILVIYLQYC